MKFNTDKPMIKCTGRRVEVLKNPIDFQGGQILHQLIGPKEILPSQAVDSKYLENKDQTKIFLLCLISSCKQSLAFQRKPNHPQPSYTLKENSLTTNIRLKFRHMKCDCKHYLNIGLCASSAC